MSSQPNRFDLLRLLFAGVVAIFHAVFLSGMNRRGDWELFLAKASELSIQGFFIISGCLVLGSLVRSQTTGLYAEKRVRRLYPAYLVVILVPALISLILTGNFQKVLSYIVPNLGFFNFIEPTLPGLFDNYAGIVNGALWTLKIEVMFYISLPVIWWFVKKPGKLCVAIYISLFLGAEIWRQFFMHYDHAYSGQLMRQLPGQMGYFAAGMLLNQYWHKLTQPKLWWALLSIVVIALTFMVPILHILRAPALALLIAYMAFASGPRLDAAKYGDLSYGIYITHFPIIQMCIVLGLFATPVLGLVVSLGLTLIASYALWHLVEKRALLPSSHYRKTS